MSFQKSCLLFWVQLLFWGCSETPKGVRSPNAISASSIHHFVYFAADRDRILDPGFVRTSALEGAQILYSWKDLEPQKDIYDFSKIKNDLKTLNAKGKKLFIQLYYTTFSAKSIKVPGYLQHDPIYDGGVVTQYDDEGMPAGWVMMVWNPSVRTRFHALIRALGKEFDGKIEGLTLQETAIDVVIKGKPIPKDFEYKKYCEAIKSDMSAANDAFKVSKVIQYANFMPGEWLPGDDHQYLRSIYLFAQERGIGVGAPDLMPSKKSYQNHAYKLMHELEKRTPIGIAVQDGNYIGKTNDETILNAPWPNLVPSLAGYAQNYLHANYIFWGAQEPYFSHDVIPYLNP